MMEIITGLRNLLTDPLSTWPTLQGKGHHVLELVKDHPWITLGVTTGTALLWGYLRTPRNLPPGPTNFPIVGAISVGSKPWEDMHKWRPIYGELVSFYSFGKLFVVLNSDRVIREALLKKGEEFSHRVDRCSFIELLGIKDEIFTAEYNETWKKNKKFAVATLKSFGFGTASSENKIYHQLGHLENALLASKGTPLDVSDDLQLFATGLVSSIVLGGGLSWKDPNVTELLRLVNVWAATFEQTTFATSLSLFVHISIVKIICWRGVSKSKLTLHNIIQHLKTRVENHLKGLSMREPQDVVDAYLKERGTDPTAVDQIANNIIGFLLDAIHTASITYLWVLFYIAYYPEVKRRLQQEVDAVCGRDRKPSIADRPAMPFAQAILHEALRHSNTIPFSLGRLLQQDVQLDSYTLPKGAIVSANIYGVHFDPELFPSPTTFYPSRFINEDGKFNSSLGGKVLPFLLGSRKCVGEAFVKVNAFLFITRMVQVFDFDFDPSVPKPSLEGCEYTFLRRPSEFKLCFKPRS